MSTPTPNADRNLIDSIIHNRINGDSCVETAEKYMEDVRTVDLQLYSALKRLNEAAEDMVSRLQELNKDLDLGHDEDFI